MKALAFALLLVLTGTACRGPVDRTFPFWAYRQHVTEYQALCADLDKHLTATHDQSRIVGLTDSLVQYITLLEDTLMRVAGLPDLITMKEPPEMDRLLDPSLASDLLIGDEPAREAAHSLSARTLKRRLDEYVFKTSQCTGLPLLAVRGMLDTRDRPGPSGILTSWEAGTFYHMPLIHALDELNRLKHYARRLELVGLMSGIKPTDELRPGLVERARLDTAITALLQDITARRIDRVITRTRLPLSAVSVDALGLPINSTEDTVDADTLERHWDVFFAPWYLDRLRHWRGTATDETVFQRQGDQLHIVLVHHTYLEQGPSQGEEITQYLDLLWQHDSLWVTDLGRNEQGVR